MRYVIAMLVFFALPAHAADITMIPASTTTWTEVPSVGNQNIYIVSDGFYSFWIGATDPETAGESVWPRMSGSLEIKQPGDSIWLNSHGTVVISVFVGNTSFEMGRFENLSNNGEPE